jgi:hypothetical protein
MSTSFTVDTLLNTEYLCRQPRMIVFWYCRVCRFDLLTSTAPFSTTVSKGTSNNSVQRLPTNKQAVGTMAGYRDGQPHSAESRTQPGGSQWRDLPQPLHITKRSDLRRGNQTVRGSRRCSPESDGAGASMDSPLEPPGGRPLTLPKRRGGRGGWVTYPVGCTRDKDKGPGSTDGWFPLISSHVCDACC